MMQWPHHRHHSLAELEWMVAPAVITGQFSLAEAHSNETGMRTPVGTILWARISAEVDERLTASIDRPLRLKPDEWRSGDIVWIIDAVGDRRVVAQMLKQFAEKEGPEKQIRIRAMGRDGKMRVGILGSKNASVSPATPNLTGDGE